MHGGLGLVAKLVRLKWSFPTLSGLLSSSSSRGTRAAEPPSSSSSSAVAYEQAFHRTVARPYGTEHMDKLRGEFESFVAEQGAKDGLRSLADFSKGRQMAEALIDQYVDDFMSHKRGGQQAREGAKFDEHSPRTMLQMAQLYLLAEDYRNCSEQAWAAARMSVYNFAERVHTDMGADWDLEAYTKSHAWIKKLGSTFLAGKRMPEPGESGELKLKYAWDLADKCHVNFYDDKFGSGEMDEDLTIVAALVGTIDTFVVDEEAKKRLAKFKCDVDAEKKRQKQKKGVKQGEEAAERRE